MKTYYRIVALIGIAGLVVQAWFPIASVPVGYAVGTFFCRVWFADERIATR